jgi:hypothetical protein
VVRNRTFRISAPAAGVQKNPEIKHFRDTGVLVSRLRTIERVIYHETEQVPHLPPWRLAVCLDCQHCFDGVTHERCTACESKHVAALDAILENLQEFRKALTPGP